MTSHTQDKCSNQTTVTVKEGSFVHFFQLRLNWVFVVAHLDSSYVTTGWGTSWCHRPLGYPAGICWLPRYKSTKQREEKISSLEWKGKKRHKQFKQDNSAVLSNRLNHLSTNSWSKANFSFQFLVSYMYVAMCSKVWSWSLVRIKVSETINSPNAVHKICLGQFGRIKIKIFGVQRVK